MSELKRELMGDVADFHSILSELDGCLARLVQAEENLQRSLQQIARIESWLDPRRLIARLRMLAARMEVHLPLAH